MRVLVTGDRGFIGSVMVPMLLGSGHDVVGMDTDFYRDCSFGSDIPPDIERARGDIRDAAVDDFVDFDAVIHLAALSNDLLGDLDSELTYDINDIATRRLGR